jgi:flagellar protein FlaG
MSVANVGYIPVSPMPAAEPKGQTAKPEAKERPQIQSTQAKAQDIVRMGSAFNKKLQFVVDHSSNEVLVKVIDKDTDKVIKVIPPEELQRLHRSLKEAIGLLFSEMA